MPVRRPVDGPPGGADQGRYLAREVLVIPRAGMPCEDLEEDLIRLRAPHRTLMDQQHEVHPRVRIELQEDPDVLPKVEGLGRGVSLDLRPVDRREGLEALPVKPLEGLKVRVAHSAKDPEGHVIEVLGELVVEVPVGGLPRPLLLAEALPEALPLAFRETLVRALESRTSEDLAHALADALREVLRRGRRARLHVEDLQEEQRDFRRCFEGFGAPERILRRLERDGFGGVSIIAARGLQRAQGEGLNRSQGSAEGPGTP